MPFRFLEDETTADVAFEAWNTGLAGVFCDAGDAVMSVMIENIGAIEPRETRTIELASETLDLLLFNFLEQLVYYKDAQQLLLRVAEADVISSDNAWRVRAVGKGERLDPSRHHQAVDVKAVTLHRFSLVQNDAGWQAHVILDI